MLAASTSLSRIDFRNSFIMSWIVEKLAQRLQRFGAEPRPLLFREQRALEPYQSLFQERPESLQSRSKASRSERTKVLNLFSDIFKVIGQEAFLLCVLAGTITKWAKLDSEDAFFIIQKWWKTVTCPTGLTVVAREVCSQFSGSISPHSQASFNNTENHRDSDATIPLDQVPSSDAMSTGDDAGRIQFLPETPYERSDPETCNPSIHQYEKH